MNGLAGIWKLSLKPRIAIGEVAAYATYFKGPSANMMGTLDLYNMGNYSYGLGQVLLI